MQLPLTDEESRDLEQALGTYLIELERELARTEVRTLQHALHLSFDRLDAIRQRLRRLHAGPEPATPSA